LDLRDHCHSREAVCTIRIFIGERSAPAPR